MPVRVLHVSYPLAPVSSDAVGGAEQVLHLVDAALVASGRPSAVVAPAGSCTAGRLFPSVAIAGVADEAAKEAAVEAHAEAVRRAVAAFRPDVVHAHGLEFERTLPRGGPLAMATLHLPPGWYTESSLSRRPDVALVCVSEAQSRALPPGAPLTAIVPNGIPLDAYGPSTEKEPFALVLARICPEKGIHLALDGARAQGIPLVVAGRVFPYPEHVRYFDSEVRPRLDGERRFVGPVGGTDKRRLLARARCVVVASLAPETSSLVAMEALASGTPVVARRIGALPEIVEHGRTGFLVDRDEDLGPAMAEAAGLSSEACRRAAEARFDAREMVRRYVALYERLSEASRCERSRHERPARWAPVPPMNGGVTTTTTPRRGPFCARSADGGAPATTTATATPTSAPTSTTTPASIPPATQRHPSPSLAVSDLHGLPALAALALEWSDLVSRDPHATPFQRPEWLLPYCRAFGVDRPWAVLLRRGGRLAGLLPLVVYPDGDRRVATLLGGGISDWQDAIVDADVAPEGAALLLAHVAAQRSRFDALLLEHVPAGSALARLGAPEGLRADEDGPDEPCLTVALPDGPDGLEERVAPHVARNAQYGARRLARMGAIAVERAGPSRLGAYLDALLALHAARWRSRGEAGVLATERAVRFHRASAPALLAAGLLRPYLLTVDGRAAAAVHAFLDRGRGYVYLTGFDPAFRAGNPGTVLLWRAAVALIADGARELDFLRGRERYKRDWGARERPARRRLFTVGRHGSAPAARDRTVSLEPAR